MKTHLRALAATVLICLQTGLLMATEKPDCPDNSCFDTQIISEEKDGDCTTYTLEISQDGSCRYALSHFNIEVGCGQITDVSNSEGWAMEIGTNDPTTGITGIKIDDIKKFGESSSPQSFTVTYTICNTGNCQPEDLIPARVAYKASNCVHYQDVPPLYTPMSASLQPTDASCVENTDGSIDLQLEGGTAPYTYAWSNGATTEDLHGIAAGAYSVIITDAIGETLSLQAQVSAPEALSLSLSTSTPSCTQNDGSIDLTVEGGSGDYTYEWSNGATTQDLENLEAGDYSVTITDGNGCSSTENISLSAATSTISLEFNTELPGCPDDSDGTIDLIVSGGSGGYTYEWSNGATTQDLDQLPAGDYTVTVTDDNGCTASGDVTLAAPRAIFIRPVTTVNANCLGEGGSLEVEASFGTAPYTYSWSNDQTGASISNLEPGYYTVTVTDANNCTNQRRFQISGETPPEVSISTENCGNTLAVSVSGGTAPYTFEWNTGADSEQIEISEGGTYELSVTDANGCSTTQSIIVADPSTPISLEASVQQPGCEGAGNGSIDLTVEGGSGDYTYEWNNGATTEDLENLPAGDYSVTVTDSRGCSSTEEISLTAPASTISLDFEVQQPRCQGDSDGSIDLIVSGGSGEYTYEWSNDTTTEDLDQLLAGDYTVTVTDSNGCTASGDVTLAAPRAIFIRPVTTVNANCLGEGGSLEVEASFGTAPYTYSWSNGETGASISNLEPGYYTVTVTDYNDCSSQRRFSITQESGPTVSISSSGCENEFQLSAEVSGGTAPYTYEWSNGENSLGTTVAHGTHSITVTDASGCSSTAEINLQQADTELSLQADITPVSCAGGSNGAATIQVSGGVGPYSFDWSNQQEGSTATNLRADLYSVLVKDANGCEKQLAFTVSEPSPLSITGIVSNNESCTEPTGSIEIEVRGGTQPYSYEWNTGERESNLNDLAAGSYTLTVSDANNCVAIRSFTLEDVSNSRNLVASLLPAREGTICQGSSTTIPVEFTGEGPYTFVYADGLAAYSITTDANPYLLEVTPESTTTYSLLSISNSCGQGVAGGEATITVEDCPEGKTPVCEDGCFSTEIISNVNDGDCQTITLQVNSDGNCRYALSHFNIALSCGTASEVSNSGGWPMEVNAYDPTTGIYGIKIDDIKRFGEGKSPQSFTVTYTVCSDDESCQESLRSESLKLGYKAGQCAYYNEAAQPEQPQEFIPGEIVVVPDFLLYPNPLSQEGTLNLKVMDVYSTANANLTISSISGIIVHQQQYEVSERNNIISISFQYLPAGTYVVKMEVKGHMITKQLYVL